MFYFGFFLSDSVQRITNQSAFYLLFINFFLQTNGYGTEYIESLRYKFDKIWTYFHFKTVCEKILYF